MNGDTKSDRTRRVSAVPMLGEWTDGRTNNLDALRLLGAILVIFSHSFAIAGLPVKLPPFYKGEYGGVGVDIFFVISGFLITQSYLRSRRPGYFMWSRFLRLFPALVVVTLCLVCVLGPWLTTLPTGAYFAHPWTRTYVRGAVSLYEVNRYTVLPGVFMDNPIVLANGPLWTLQYEWTFYLVVLGLGITGLLQRKGIATVLFVISLVLTHFYLGSSRTIYWTSVYFSFVFFLYFSFGVLAYLIRDQIPMTWGAALFVVGVLAFGSLKGGFSDVFFVFLLGYLILFVGLNPKINLTWLTKSGDYSYGLYLWGWPVQQTVFLFLGRERSVWLQLCASIAIALCLAVVSWHVVEKRALSLKRYARAPRQPI